MGLLWKRRQAQAKPSSALPAEVLAALDGATVHARSPGEDGAPRVLFQPAGLRGWMHSQEADSKALRKCFPELNDEQLRRACRYVASIVASHLRQTASGGRKRRRNWVHDYGFGSDWIEQ